MKTVSKESKTGRGSANTILLLVLLACAWTARCGGEPASDTESQAELERLWALGYVGFTDTQVKPGEPSVTLHDPERSASGYNLISNRDLTSAQIYDAQGSVVWSWQDEHANHWSHAELLANGDLLVPGSERADTPGSNFLLRMAWDGDVVWRKAINAHHDAEVTPAGTIATLTFRLRSIPEISAEHDVEDNQIAILTQDGEVLEEYSLHDMLCTQPDVFACQEVPPTYQGEERIIDLLHANSVEFMRHAHLAERDALYAPANVLVSIRNQNVVAIFDWERKRLVWVWGPGEISAQHDATVLENGNILIFDNGVLRRRSRVIELDPLRREIVWQYEAPDPERFFSVRKGSSQRLPNGNTLVANSHSGEAFEVTPQGEMVWRFLNPNANPQGRRATIVRIHRYPEELIRDLLNRGRSPERGD
jgi:hypothetical protein